MLGLEPLHLNEFQSAEYPRTGVSSLEASLLSQGDDRPKCPPAEGTSEHRTGVGDCWHRRGTRRCHPMSKF